MNTLISQDVFKERACEDNTDCLIKSDSKKLVLEEMFSIDLFDRSKEYDRKNFEINKKQHSDMVKWVRMMLNANRIEVCDRLSICHFVLHFTVSSLEKHGDVRIVGNFINLNDVTRKMETTITYDLLVICKNSARFKYRCKIDLIKAFYSIPLKS